MKRTVWKYIRVRFLPGTDPKGKRTKLSRPKRIYEISIYDKDDNLKNTEYAPVGVIGTIRRIDSTTFTTEWVHGPTPTPKPSNKYSDEQLKKFGYSDDLIKTIRRNYSSKDITLVCNNIKINRKEAKKLLEESGGNRHKIYVKRKTKGVKIDGDWKNNAPGEKSEKGKINMKKHKDNNQSSRSKKTISKSHKRKAKREGRF